MKLKSTYLTLTNATSGSQSTIHATFKKTKHCDNWFESFHPIWEQFLYFGSVIKLTLCYTLKFWRKPCCHMLCLEYLFKVCFSMIMFCNTQRSEARNDSLNIMLLGYTGHYILKYFDVKKCMVRCWSYAWYKLLSLLLDKSPIN